MEGLLSAVKTTRNGTGSSLETADVLIAPSAQVEQGKAHQPTHSASPDYILGVLRSNPDYEQIIEVLLTLDPSRKDKDAKDFDIRIPSPKAAQIFQAMVSTTIPTHWERLNDSTRGKRSPESKAKAALLRCLCSVPGISSLLTQLRLLCAEYQGENRESKESGKAIVIRDILSVLSHLLKPEDLIIRLFTDLGSIFTNEAQKQTAWREFVSLIAASKVLSTSAEVLALLKEQDDSNPSSWLGEGSRYAVWLGDNIRGFASKIDMTSETGWKSIAFLMSRAMSLGYTDQLVKGIYLGLLIEMPLSNRFNMFLNGLRPSDQLGVLMSIFRDLEKKYFAEELSGQEIDITSSEYINGIATLCATVLENRSYLEAQVIELLAKGQSSYIQTLGLRRSLLTNFAKREDSLRNIVNKSFGNFGDKLYMKHTPTLIQNANAQALLLATGYLHRLNPSAVVEIGRSSLFLSSISNRLAASSARSRFLGMVVGMAISRLIEEPGKAMRFDLEEMESDSANRYLSLTTTNDQLGSVECLKTEISAIPKRRMPPKVSFSKTTGVSRAQSGASSKIISIEEIVDSDVDGDEDELMPYEKPDDDPSDSDDDPTLVQRIKPTAPVYIRDLIVYLRDSENIERYDLALRTAPSLIRRKTGFGTELVEHTNELALVLVSLQDVSKSSKFHEYRLQSMMALIVSQPSKMGRWFSAMFFDGDISQAQRSAILTALGLSARELGGNGEEDAQTLGLPTLPDSSFPSKKLPANLERLYLTDESPVSSLARQLSQASLQPLAANAADTLSGPNALKVRTFSSRMDVEKKRQQRDVQRQKSTIKDLYPVLSESFFYPLKGRFELMMLQFSSSTAPSYNPFLSPSLLTLFLQTLSLILSTLGPNTPTLPTLTSETLSLLLSLHTSPISSDPVVLAALLSLFLNLIDLNVSSGTSGEERLVTEFAAEIIELREWAGEIFDRMPAIKGADPASDPQARVRTLAAGVMVKLGEVMERYQGRLMGVQAGFSY
ncbi:hypothetical protein ASPZODRAFT_159174 [Penicilliopsis zonata CBS 506.65]|uniref:Telomere length regulation protein conserved domain-containing protein n=1 Tax=Penicilliopsis zonata CBS 506.65 TaxID=1073090 RepID=A0A1L9SJA8_9EURO|nr:hypothetical protein ASPZODRAFT_159174 [Penicilliopsis zonata CBS 506.65]OJJ47245.1 hypothetical protein ASPZODRAFT_159174 [Penicilliopsis zonata CBS 506.65]